MPPKKPRKTIRVQFPDLRAEYVALVTPGASITIIAERQRPVNEYSAEVAPMPPESADERQPISGWLASLTQTARRELGSLIHAAKTPETESAARDWIELNGGRGDWLSKLTARFLWDEYVIEKTEETYALGDCAEYGLGPHSLHLLGSILSITAKTVTIKEQWGEKTRRLSLHEFCRRNCDPVEAKEEANRHWTD